MIDEAEWSLRLHGLRRVTWTLLVDRLSPYKAKASFLFSRAAQKRLELSELPTLPRSDRVHPWA